MTATPIPPLKPGIGFPDIVQKRQHRQTRMIDVIQAATRCVLQSSGHRWQTTQLAHNSRHVRHMINQTVNCYAVLITLQLAPRNE